MFSILYFSVSNYKWSKICVNLMSFGIEPNPRFLVRSQTFGQVKSFYYPKNANNTDLIALCLL